MSNVISPSALLQAQSTYDNNIQRNSNLPKSDETFTQTVNFQDMVNKNIQQANKNFNSFSKMSPEQIMNHARQVSNIPQNSQQSSALASTVGTISKAVQNDENVKKRSITGDASLSEVIEATSEAKTTLQTAIAVRNKLIESWNQIMNMPI